MIEKLTKEQEKQIPVFVRRYLDLPMQKTNEEVARSAIGRLWKRMGYEEPIVVFADSPVGAYLMYALYRLMGRGSLGRELSVKVNDKLWEELHDKLWGELDELDDNLGEELVGKLGREVHAKLWRELDDNLGRLVSKLWREVDDKLREELDAKLWGELYAKLGMLVSKLWRELAVKLRGEVSGKLGRVDTKLRRELDDKLWIEVDGGEKKFTNWYLSTWWIGWLALYRFGEYIGVQFDKEAIRLFDDYLSNIQFIIPFEGICFVSRNYTDLHWNESGQLHHVKEPAVQFADGYGMYMIEGVRFDRKTFKKVTRKNADIKHTLELENQEQRMAALSIQPADKLVRGLKAKEIKVGKVAIKTYDYDMKIIMKDIRMELYETDYFTDKYQFAIYECPSTGRIYHKFGEPKYAEGVELVAEYFGQTKEEYLSTIRT